MSGLEPEVQDFLKRIVSSLFLGLFWLMLNMTLGIYFGLLFVNRKISTGNIIFYIFLLGSLFLLIRFYYRTWKKKFPHGWFYLITDSQDRNFFCENLWICGQNIYWFFPSRIMGAPPFPMMIIFALAEAASSFIAFICSYCNCLSVRLSLMMCW